MLIERPQAVNTKYLEGRKENSALEIGQPGQTLSVIYSVGVPATEGTGYGGAVVEEGPCKGISPPGAAQESDFWSCL